MLADPIYLDIAMAQIRVEGGKPDANLARATDAIAQSGRDGARIVVLPECLDLGWTHPSAADLAEPIPGPRANTLAQAAAQNGVVVAAGLTERDNDRVYNAAVLIDAGGAIRHTHRKINVLDIAQDLYAIGDRLGVVRTELGTLGLDICADNFPNALHAGTTLAHMSADVILSPSAWVVDADHDQAAEPYGDLWRDAYTKLTRRSGIGIVGVSNVGPITAGPWAGRKCIGCSMAVGPDGTILAQAPYDEEAVVHVRMPVTPDRPRGTDFSGMLHDESYEKA
jgi:predicted amidohydrolase